MWLKRNRDGPDPEVGFTLVELLIVVAIIGIISAIVVPNLLQAVRKSEFSAMMTEAKNFQNALVRYNIDKGRFPLDNVFNRTSLEPLVSEGYLETNSLIRYLRDDEIHNYEFDPDNGPPLKWHCHPRMKPYDNGPQKINIEGDGTSVTITYLGQAYDSSTILPLIQ